MPAVDVIVLHPPAPPGAGPLETALAGARAELADRHRRAFARLVGPSVRIVEGAPDGRPFGARLRELVADRAADRGLVVLGSGSLPLATTGDLRAFVGAAAGDGRRALANNRFSSDALALTAEAAAALDRVPMALPGDNALPRWLAEVALVPVDDMRRRWRLGIDLDSPLDILLVRASRPRDHPPLPLPVGVGEAVAAELASVRTRLGDPRAEVVVAGRTSAATLAWLERTARCRIRALVEERGLRASTRLAMAEGVADGRTSRSGLRARPPRSVLGMVLDRDGPEALGERLAELGDAAIIDSRVLLAHRFGADEAAWPAAEDRYASDLLEPTGIADPWLRSLTTSAVGAPIPILLGGHTLVGPGVRLLRPLAAPG